MTVQHDPPEHPHSDLAHPLGPLPPQPWSLAVRPLAQGERMLRDGVVGAAFGAPVIPDSPAQQERRAAMLTEDNQRVVVARGADGTQRIIGGRSRYDTALSLPGGARVPVAALAAVGVDPAARAHGAMRVLLRSHLDECRERGDAASVLMASVAGLYGRYGYGAASQCAHWQIDGAAAGLRADAPSAGSVHLEHGRGAELHRILDAVWNAAGSARAGTMDRSDAWWNLVLSPEPTWLGGGKLHVAVHTSGGQPRGYALYTEDVDHGRQGLSEADVELKELVAVDAAAELDLWRHIAALPWLRRIDWHYGPIDPAPLFWLTDARQLRRMAQFDFLWVRPLDYPALMAARGFDQDGRVELQVNDPVFPDLAGRFDLVVDGGSGRWLPASGAAALTVSAGELGALMLGEGSAREMLAMGLITGSSAAAKELDVLLGTGLAARTVARF